MSSAKCGEIIFSLCLHIRKNNFATFDRAKPVTELERSASEALRDRKQNPPVLPSEASASLSRGSRRSVSKPKTIIPKTPFSPPAALVTSKKHQQARHQEPSIRASIRKAFSFRSAASKEKLANPAVPRYGGPHKPPALHRSFAPD